MFKLAEIYKYQFDISKALEERINYDSCLRNNNQRWRKFVIVFTVVTEAWDEL
jgi:hypothetical protein